MQVRNLNIAQINSRLTECSLYRASHVVDRTPADANVVTMVTAVYGDHWNAQISLDDKMRAHMHFSNGTIIRCKDMRFEHPEEIVQSLYEYDPLDSRWGRMFQGVSIEERNRRKSLGIM